MFRLEGPLTLALILSSGAAVAQEPKSELTAADPLRVEPPHTLHWRPDEADRPLEPAPLNSQAEARDAAAAGLLSPFTAPAAISGARASAQSYAGYDSAAAAGRVRAVADGRLTNFLAMRVEFEHGPGTGSEDRLSVGARVGILTEQRFGVDLGAGLFYQPKDFRGEGDVAVGLMLARHFERLGLFANALFGSDPEGDDQSLELRFGSLYSASRWLTVGIDARSRLTFSEDQKRVLTRSVDWELQAAPTAIVCLGPFSVMGLLGPSMLEETPAQGELSHTTRLHVGLLAMAGAGGTF